MEFPKEYFEGEEREGFYIAPMMKKAWAAQIEVLCEIDKVCKRHNIQYFAEWGTLLGAVRHKGFIPWDDDLDIGMKRQDFNKFFKVAKDELPEGFVALNMHDYEDYNTMLGRVVNTDTIRFDEAFLTKFHGCPYALGIDIFPLDFVAPNDTERELQCNLIHIVNAAEWCMDAAARNEEVDYEELGNVIRQIQELCGVKFNSDSPLRKQLCKLKESLCAMYSEEEAEEITLMSDLAEKFPHYRIPKEDYQEFIDMPFENITIPVPVGYDTALRIKYGDDYMTPINKTSSHDYPFYKNQEQMVVDKLGFRPE